MNEAQQLSTENRHSLMVKTLVKDANQIAEELTADEVDRWHGATGVCTEAGELLDAIKKEVIYQRGLDKENVIEELGDIEFYLEQIRQNLNITREDVLKANINKLSIRYAQGYSDKAAQTRADKA